MPPKKNGYKMPDPLPKGLVLEDRSKKQWKLGASIGKGGFGEIYAAQPLEAAGSNYPNVIKIEPHSNGPLFVEMHFYVRNGKPQDISDFMKTKGLNTFGMPCFLGSGSHEHKGEKYRFVVMEKFGSDIWKLFLENDRKFPEATVFQLGIQILDVLEYIHGQGYVHADIKGANILLGITKETKNKQVYLVDFGLATKFTTETVFKPDPKKAHDGTIEYLSRDAHKGVQTRRGDLEILVYNLIQWLGNRLPWEKNLSDPKIVQQSKEDHMATVAKMTAACFKDGEASATITDYLKYLKSLEFNTQPDYSKLRKILEKGVKDSGGSVGGPLELSMKSTSNKRKSTNADSPKKKAKTAARTTRTEEDSGEEDETIPKKKVPQARGRGRGARAGSEPPPSVVAVSEPKKRGRKAANKENVATVKEEEEEQPGEMSGYTEAMKEVLRRKEANGGTKPKVVRKRRATVDQDKLGGNFNEEMREVADRLEPALPESPLRRSGRSRTKPCYTETKD